MGLFDKKYCDICGEKIGLLGNCKLDDGNLCKECAQKLSPWFEERRHSTVEEIKRQLAYREQNKELVQKFNVTRQISTKTYNVFIDDIQGNFTIAHKLDGKRILILCRCLQCFSVRWILSRIAKKRPIQKMAKRSAMIRRFISMNISTG